MKVLTLMVVVFLMGIGTVSAVESFAPASTHALRAFAR